MVACPLLRTLKLSGYSQRLASKIGFTMVDAYEMAGDNDANASNHSNSPAD